MTTMKTRTYSAAETRIMLGISKSTLLKAAREGTLYPPIRHIRAGEAVRFVKVDVDAAVGEDAA